MAKGKRSQIGLHDLVKAGLLKPGEELVHDRRGATGAKARITEDGCLVTGGRRFTTPSAAASSVMGGRALNGWIFWRYQVDGQRAAISELRSRLEEEKNPQD